MGEVISDDSQFAIMMVRLILANSIAHAKKWS